jgi:hypothetical protein
MRRLWILFCAVFLYGAAATRAEDELYEQPPINYSSARAQDAAARLQARIAAGEIKLGQTDRHLVEMLLRELGIPVDSQILVFSKTSLQRERISPERPRALYFSDTCYVGWVPSGLIEVVGVDPVLGPVFYAIDPASARTNASHCLTRDSDCLRCHGGTFVRGIPGVFARSIFTAQSGEPLLRYGSDLVDFRTPFANRWGGWYVTGTHGAALHRGNVFASEMRDELAVDATKGANVTNLSRFFDTSSYLAASSDIVALLVFEAQLTAQNSLTRASLNCRRMLDYQKRLQRELKEPVNDEPDYESVKSVFENSARELVDDLLFKDEAELPPGIKGSPAFQHAFLQKAIRARDGSSLKDLDLEKHLFRNRCSYLIYSEAFIALPQPLKNRVFTRLNRALSETAPDPRYEYLGDSERARIRSILRETHPEFRSLFASAIGPSMAEVAARQP